MLSAVLDRIAEFFLSYFNPTYEVERILGVFTRMVKRLDDVIAKIDHDVSASYTRVDNAWVAFRQTDNNERALREGLKTAKAQAATARQKISEIVGA